MKQLSDYLYYHEAGPPDLKIYKGDCLEVMPLLHGGVDLVVTDPPYSFGLASTDSEGKSGSWADLMNNAYFYALCLKEFKRLMANTNGAAWVFNSWSSFPCLAKASCDTNFPIVSLLVWDKQWIGPGGSTGLRPSYELVALYATNNFALKDMGLPDIWQSQWASQRPHGHPAEKPQNLIKKIIEKSGGGLVLDPFLGSGKVLSSCKLLNRPGIGIETNEKYCEIAKKRLQNTQVPFL